MLKPNDKTKFLSELADLPNVSVICRRMGIARSTIYRWREEDAKFAKMMDKSISHGREGVCDLAEGVVVGRMKKGDLNAAKYWLDNNDKRYYKPRRPVAAPPMRGPIQTVRYEIVNPREIEMPPKAAKPPPLVILNRRPK
jgi:hypothetical protein